MNFSNKKGDVNWFLVSLIIIIVSLVVIVLIFLRINFSGDSDRIACMESALVKSSLPDSLDIKDIASLKCKTKRICVTLNTLAKGKCEDKLGNSYTTFRLTGNDESRKNQIKMVLAREMADCWNMLGEGNLMIFSSDITKNPINGKAVLCSRVMFDKSVTAKFSSVTGMNSYLLSHKVPGKEISYWDYFRNSFDGDTLQMLNGEIVKGTVSMDAFNDNLDLTQQKAIFYLESSVSKMGAAIGAVGGAAAATLVMGSFGGAGFKGAAILGRVISLGSPSGSVLGPLAVLSGAGYAGSSFGQSLYEKYFAPDLDGKKSVAGVFLTDYSVEGFRSFQDQKISFESIA